jgi:hypothetical protein
VDLGAVDVSLHAAAARRERLIPRNLRCWRMDLWLGRSGLRPDNEGGDATAKIRCKDD